MRLAEIEGVDYAERLLQFKQECRVGIDAHLRGVTFYRGAQSLKHGMRKIPHQTERRSPYAGSNHYNLMFSNLPSWSKYPPRNKSVIGSTSFGRADNYQGSDAMVIIPVGDPWVGICPEEDIWDSFEQAMYDLVELIKDARPEVFHLYQSWQGLYYDMKGENLGSLSTILDALQVTDRNYPMMIEQLTQTLKAPASKLDAVFSPMRNGFKLMRLSKIMPPEENKEIWFRAPFWSFNPKWFRSIEFLELIKD